MHYNAKTVLYFVGYSYIMHLINAQKMKHIKSKKKLRLLYLFIHSFFSPPTHARARTHTHRYAYTLCSKSSLNTYLSWER